MVGVTATVSESDIMVAPGKVRYQTEILSVSLIKEAHDLMAMQRDELCLHDDFELDPDWEAYFTLSATGQLVICTARKNEELIGYAAYALHQNMHYRKIKCAVQDVLFLHSSKRGTMAGYRLIQFADSYLASLGVQLVSHHVKVKFDFGPMLERLGYEQSEKIFEKRLD